MSQNLPTVRAKAIPVARKPGAGLVSRAPVFKLPQSQALVLDLDMETGFDKTANKSHGAIYGATVSRGTNQMYVARSFDGIDDTIQCAHPAAVRTLVDNTWSFGAWIYPTESKEGTVMRLGGAANGYLMRTEPSGNLCVIMGATVDFAYFETASHIQPNNWYHVLVVYDGTKLYNYVNNVAESSTLNKTLSFVQDQNLHIGSVDASAEFFKGLILAPHVWNKGLTAAEVATVYKQEKSLYGL